MPVFTRLRDTRDAHPAAARALRRTLHVLAAALVVGALLMPNTAPALRPDRFTRIPAEAVIGAVPLLAPPRRPRIVVAALYGAGIGVPTVLNLLDIGFTEYLGRGFNVVLDWELLDDAQTYVADSTGSAAATAAAVGAVVLALLLVTVMALAAVFLGDHQPIARVSGDRASRDVPVSVVAKDPEVLEKTDAWNWTEGLTPAKDAPVWRMSSFRDRFLTAYGSVPHPTKG